AIQQVTVFIKGAQVTRTATAALPPGTTTLTFNGLSPDIDEKSIQVQGDGAFTILSVSSQKNFMQEQVQRGEITDLQNQLDDLDEKIKHEKNLLHVYAEEAAMMSKNQSIGGNNNGVKTADLKEAMDFQRARLTEIAEKQQGIEKNIAGMEQNRQKISNQLSALQQQKKDPTSDILVTVTSKTTLTAKFTIRYVVEHAGWYPNYDIRVQSITAPLVLQYKARVFQQCGEEWKNVKLSLSTGNPKERTEKPTLTPWYIHTYDSPTQMQYQQTFQDATRAHEARGRVVDASGAPLPGISVQVAGRTIGTVTDANGNYSLQMPDGAQRLHLSGVGFEPQEISANGTDYKSTALQAASASLDEVVVVAYGAQEKRSVTGALQGKVAGVKIRGVSTMDAAPASIPIAVTQNFSSTTFTYDIELPYSIASDGRPYTVDIKEMQVPANYQYYTAPRLDKAAYLTAGIINWEDLNLLEGEASIYFEGTYLGRSLLNLQNTGDTLNLSLGVDKQVVVNRTLQKEYSKKQFLANNNTAERAYELRVKNNKGVPIHITVQDQVPLSPGKEVEISHVEFNGATETPNTGQLNWNLDLAPSAEKKMNVKYTVKYPRDRYVNLD
ncbi:MAG TPA: DUF4139 domain-containing protein, partial [Chitinophaga sp.]